MVKKRIENAGKLHKEFIGLANYHDNLAFYDQHFGILPFKFPVFKPELDILLKGDEINFLMEIFQKERKQPLNFIQTINDSTEIFVFNITPANTNRQFLTDYIINYFLSHDEGFNQIIKKIEETLATKKQAWNMTLKAGNELVNLIKYKLSHNKERSFRNQFLHVFQNGFNDYQSKFIKRFPHQKEINRTLPVCPRYFVCQICRNTRKEEICQHFF